MKAFVLRSYGSPEHLALTDTDQPVPAAGEVLVRVRATPNARRPGSTPGTALASTRR